METEAIFLTILYRELGRGGYLFNFNKNLFKLCHLFSYTVADILTLQYSCKAIYIVQNQLLIILYFVEHSPI
jgi:hypothetical protein